jgi:hypothetical protein
MTLIDADGTLRMWTSKVSEQCFSSWCFASPDIVYLQRLVFIVQYSTYYVQYSRPRQRRIVCIDREEFFRVLLLYFVPYEKNYHFRQAILQYLDDQNFLLQLHSMEAC